MKVLIFLAILLCGANATKHDTERCHPQDKRALLRIKQQSFNNTALFDSWDPTTDCCNGWILVDCDDSSNRVTKLTLIDIDTEGAPFPSALGDLPYVEEVMFEGNNATGSIPASLANLRRLFYFSINRNRLTGPIPSFFSRFPNLNSLDLSNNMLSGSIPPALALAPSIDAIDFSVNRLTGSIPESFGRFKKDLVQLFLSDNKLSGEIPSSFRDAKIYELNVGRNNLKGDPSFLFGKRKQTTEIDLSFNSFAFDMSDLEIPLGMNILDLSHNRIYGSLPEGLAHLPQLNIFDVSYNRLCGRIPTGGTLAQFHNTSYLHNKCLCGTPLPPCK